MSSPGSALPAAYAARAGNARSDRGAVIALWRGNLGLEERLAAKYDWFYEGCPYGEPILQLLRHEPTGSWVGTAAAGPRRMAAAGGALSAGLLVDLAVSTQHRSLGPALTLQKALMAAAGERFDLVYGFPNPKAAAVFKRVGYARLGEIVRYARVVRHGKHLERFMAPAVARPLGWMLDGTSLLRQAVAARRGTGPRWISRWADAVDPQIDELWSRSAHGDEPIAARDVPFLRWRFDQAPLPKTRYLLVSDPGSGQLQGWFACQAEGDTLHVRDFWSIDAAAGIGQSFIETLLRAVRLAGHSVVSVEYAGPVQRRAAWLDAGFMARTRRPVFGSWKNASSGGDDRADIHLTSADEDE